MYTGAGSCAASKTQHYKPLKTATAKFFIVGAEHTFKRRTQYCATTLTLKESLPLKTPF